MNDLKFLELPDGKKYPMCLSINVMVELQKKYGSFEETMELIDSSKQNEINYAVLIDFYYYSINEGIDIYNENKNEQEKMNFVSERQAGRIISELGFAKSKETAKSTVISTDTSTSTKSADDGETVLKNV